MVFNTHGTATGAPDTSSRYRLPKKHQQIVGEALCNVNEAIEVYLESLRERNEPIPPPIDEEIVEVAT